MNEIGQSLRAELLFLIYLALLNFTELIFISALPCVDGSFNQMDSLLGAYFFSNPSHVYIAMQSNGDKGCSMVLVTIVICASIGGFGKGVKCNIHYDFAYLGSGALWIYWMIKIK